MKTLSLLLSTCCCLQAAQVVYLSPSSNLSRDWGEAVSKLPGAIIFRPGDYTVRGEMALPAALSNCVISGYGAKLWLTGTNMSGQYHMLRSHWNGNEGIVWEGFTLDAGTRTHWSGPGKSVGLVQIGSGTIRNCSVYNLVSNGGDESFGLTLRGTNGTCSGNVVVGVLSRSNALVTGISLQGESVSATANSVDLGDTSGTNSVTTFGYTLYGSHCVLSGNTSRRCDAGFSQDGAGSEEATTWRDNTITGCQFSGNVMCVRIDTNYQPYRGWVFSGNVFSADSGAWLAIGTHGLPWRANKVEGFTFVGNRFTGRPQAAGNVSVWNYGGNPHSFIGNTFDSVPLVNTGTNRNTLYGSGNVVLGEPSNRAFGTDRTEWSAQ